MPAITLKGHFDGERILLDEPFELQPNAPLMITVLPVTADEERAAWSQLAAMNLARAYSEQEAEYSGADVKP